MIAIIDYKMGNLRSVEKGFEHAGVADVVVTDDPAVVDAADGIVLPGVGAFRDAAANLRVSGVEPVLRHKVGHGTPFLGICLGMQLLATTGLEDGDWGGLGMVPGVCDRLPGGVKVPHIGWNTVEYPRDSLLFDGIAESTAFYFVHSYRLRPDDDAAVIGSTEYGVRFAAAVQSDNIYAVQFHPEKSSGDGLRLLANFGRIVEGARA
ncbi:MAG: imidazole glycerol phosphate synthase subunit HisH [Actinobacteria bacterium]|nr:MAG: imidazole glycerol phosphate synthase subunit HisH [Actinomycetota bacterium]